MSEVVDHASTQDARAIDAQVAEEALSLAYSRLPASVAMAILIGFGFIGLLFPYFEPATVATWIGVMFVAYALRWLGWSRWQRRSGANTTRRWEIVFAVGAAIAGGSWALGAVLLLPSAGAQEAMLLVVAVLVVSSTAANTLGAQFAAMVLFLGSSMLPVAATLAWNGDAIERMTALALCCWFVVMAIAGRQTTMTTLRLIRTEIERTEALAEAAEHRRRAEASSEAKSRFLANMSHEVRTPLNGVLGLAELLERGTLEPKQREHVRLLRHSGQHLLTIVNEILDLSKVEAGKLELQAEDYDLHALVAECCALLAPTALAAGLAFTDAVAADVPRTQHGDPVRVRQMLLNLIGNAIKFTPAGHVALHVHVEARADGTRPIVFDIEDTGIGITNADAERVFDAFTQAEDSANRRFGGTGLGLTLCRQLARTMGGDVSVCARVPQGSVFRLELPDVPARDAFVADATARVASTRTVGHVLLAEDNPVNREVLVAMLDSIGVRVTCVENGHEAVHAVQHERFDAVLMDCQMPLLDGYAATAAIRALAPAADHSVPDGSLPIIALTANAFADDRERARLAGMDDFVAKPVSIDVLERTLTRWLRPAGPRAATDVHRGTVH